MLKTPAPTDSYWDIIYVSFVNFLERWPNLKGVAIWEIILSSKIVLAKGQ